MKPLIQVQAVSQRFNTASGEFLALQNVSFDIVEGETISLIGHSGCGKSTLLNLIAGITTPTEGGLLCDNREIAGPGPERAVVFQNHSLLPWLSCFDNVALAVDQVFRRTMSKSERREWIEHNLARVQMGHALHKRPGEISGGMKQRVAIARALANDPQVLLCDEATSALDPQTTKAILHLLKHLNETLGITIVLITHEMAVVKEICDRVAVMEYGRVVEQGEVFTVFAEPKQDITKSFIHTTSNLQKVEELIAEDSPVTRLQPGELIVRLSYVQRNVNEPIISAVSQMFNVSLNIIFADITIVQDSPIGGTVAIISGERKQITKAIEYLIEKNVGVEVIKDARADR